MGSREDFSSADGWSVADVSVRLDTIAGQKFLSFLKESGINTVVRYYASRDRPKTITPEEAKLISGYGLSILPVFQDRARSIDDFSRSQGLDAAKSAREFAKRIGQPEGSTILFAVDADFGVEAIDGPITDYFAAINTEMNGAFKIGAYGSGALLSKLIAEQLISVPWLSMSRLFLGTEQFFYSNRWFLRQVPPEMKHTASGVGYDRNVVGVPHDQLGAFHINETGLGALAWEESADATLSGRQYSITTKIASVTSEANRFVTTEGVRLREVPNGRIIRDLTIGEAALDLGSEAVEGWRKVQIGEDQGTVFGKYLRRPERQEVEALLRATIDEWLRFDKGKGHETADPYYIYIREMWARLGEPYDGRSLEAGGSRIPWSAAFISWVVYRASLMCGGAYDGFRFAAQHSVFVNNAIKARILGRTDKPFWGYRITEAKPSLGDIIQRNRGGENYSFSHAENHASYISHSDIVVEVTPDIVRVIGGNVDNTVSMAGGHQEYALDADGFIKPDQGVIALLKNRAGLTG